MMKKLLYTLSLLVILTACRNEDDGPEMLVVTTADMVGTWVCHNESKGTFELMKFTADGEFYLTDRLDNFSFEDEDCIYRESSKVIVHTTTRRLRLIRTVPL